MTVRRLDEAEAVAWLKNGELVALPTETVYGLAARYDSADAVQKIFAAKGRPPLHPLIVHGATRDLLDRAGDLSSKVVQAHAERLATLFWPGPLTLIVPKQSAVLGCVTGNQDTVGLRVPEHAATLNVLAQLGVPVAMPSANRFGRVSPTTAKHVEDDLGPIDDIVGLLDGGPSVIGIESTIVKLTDTAVSILRPGAVTREDVEEALGVKVNELHGERVSGALASHYAPRALVRIVASEELDREVALARRSQRVAVFASRPTEVQTIVFKDADSFAQLLYRSLRELDEVADLILIEAPSSRGKGAALVDRIRKAAGPRD